MVLPEVVKRVTSNRLGAFKDCHGTSASKRQNRVLLAALCGACETPATPLGHFARPTFAADKKYSQPPT